MSLAIGPVVLDDPVILAPMSGVTDLPFRRLVRRFGVGLAVSEMIAGKAAARADRRALAMARAGRDEAPFSVQLAGRDPAAMGEAARRAVDLGASVVDVNFGCPAKKVTGGLAGAALMRDERLAARILRAVAAAVPVPLTVKMRTGWDAASRNAPALARIAADCGAAMIAVHGRTREQFYRGRADWRFIAEVVDAVDVPVVANGDVVRADDAPAILRASGAQGVMIGRGACGRPWLPAQAAARLRGAPAVPDPAPAERLDVLIDHYRALLGHYGRERGVRIARKHTAWGLRGLAGAAALRERAVRLDDADAVLRELRAFRARRAGADGDGRGGLARAA